MSQSSNYEMSQASNYELSQASTLTSNNGCNRPPKQIDYHRLLIKFLEKHNPEMVSNVDEMLSKHKGKEAKFMLILARKYDASNALNRVFVSRVTEEHFDDYLALTRLYLSIFYPQDVEQAEKLITKNKGKEDELFKKLSSNFHAINPLKMDRKSKALESFKPIDYKEALTTFYKECDPGKVADVKDVLSKCKGKENILFSVLASKYDTSNALNAVFSARLNEMKCKDHLALLKLYLSVYHPSKLVMAKTMLLAHKGSEDELFSKLATQFRGINPLEICGTLDLGRNSLETIGEAKNTTPAVIEDGYTSPVRRRAREPISRSPAVTP